MDHKKELKEQYKDIPIQAGVYKITNTQNKKVFIGSFNNLKRLNGLKFMLRTNTFSNQLLQKEWNEFGPDVFTIETVEMLKKPDEGYFDAKKELEKIEQKWIDQLQPFDDKGYNKPIETL
ncbi:GIY-YIG nuclease family protein [Rummeliibacillus pycnus]|uniref:GIY-YIG nuclease family protein n=1 Tax=Rummeliibacillus pycnus TaxID=101070 RepID=UPI003D267CB0